MDTETYTDTETPAAVPSPRYLNSHALRAGIIPCETNPFNGELSRTTEPFHATAVMSVGMRKDVIRHVCLGCALKYHEEAFATPGIFWK